MLCQVRAPLGFLQIVGDTLCPRPGSTIVSLYDLGASPWSESQFPTCKTSQKGEADDSFSLEGQQRVEKLSMPSLP